MYSVDFTRLTLDDFEELLRTVELLPGRRRLLNNLDEIFSAIKETGIKNLSELQKCLKKKKDYETLSVKFKADTDYLTILNREINAYKSKEYSLAQLELFTEEELRHLEALKIKNTRHYYEACLKHEDRKALGEKTAISEDKLLKALEYTDLLRVNGIGIVYAQAIHGMGIKTIQAYENTASEQILMKFKVYIQKNNDLNISIGLKDVDYCRRFIALLDREIEWEHQPLKDF